MRFETSDNRCIEEETAFRFARHRGFAQHQYSLPEETAYFVIDRCLYDMVDSEERLVAFFEIKGANRVFKRDDKPIAISFYKWQRLRDANERFGLPSFIVVAFDNAIVYFNTARATVEERCVVRMGGRLEPRPGSKNDREAMLYVPKRLWKICQHNIAGWKGETLKCNNGS